MKPFPAVVMIVFVALALFGVFVFATFTASQSDRIGDVAIWGAVPSEYLDEVMGTIRDTRDDFGGVTYREIPPESLVPTLVEAIAAGRGPDLVFFPSSAIVKDGEKLEPISYETISRRDFQDAFIEAGEVFLTDDGILGLPVIADPTVLYWNRTLFSKAGVSNPPRYWDDLATIAPRLTKKLPNGSIAESAVALGLYTNVPHATHAFVSLVRQLGAPIVVRDQRRGYQADLFASGTSGVTPALSAVRYIADFADPVKPMYSWNRSQKNARDAFLSGALAMYIAPASELRSLREANPNLNFDVAPLPASRTGGTAVWADITALAIPRGSGNPRGALTVGILLAGPEAQAALAKFMTLPTARRDVGVDTSADAFLDVFQAAAIRSFAFLDPDPVQSDAIFSRMFEDIVSGRTQVSQAVRTAHDDLRALLKVQ